MTKEIIKELVRKEYETKPHPHVKDDFDLVWDIHEEYQPFKENDFKPASLLECIDSIDLEDRLTKTELFDLFKDVPENATLYFSGTEDYITCEAYIHVVEDQYKIATRLYRMLYMFTNNSVYDLYKKLYMLEKCQKQV